MDDSYKLRAILHELEDFFRLRPDYEIDGLTLYTLQRIVCNQISSYLLRTKHYVIEIQEADSKMRVRDIIHRKKYRLYHIVPSYLPSPV